MSEALSSLFQSRVAGKPDRKNGIIVLSIFLARLLIGLGKIRHAPLVSLFARGDQPFTGK
jgi:hypothetical protein